MQRMIIFITATIFLVSSKPMSAQEPTQQLDVSVDPIAFFLNGVSLHGGYALDGWHLDMEAFSLDVPPSVHGNEGFTASQQGLELKMDYYFKQVAEGLFVSAGGGFSNLAVTNNARDEQQSRIEYSVGVRSGYRWNTGLGNLYLTPLAGLEVNLNSSDITIGDKTFEGGAFQPYVTANIGWYFSL